MCSFGAEEANSLVSTVNCAGEYTHTQYMTVIIDNSMFLECRENVFEFCGKKKHTVFPFMCPVFVSC